MSTANDETSTLLDRYSAAPTALRQALAALDPDRQDHGLSEGEWTPRQIVLHLVDADLVAAVRIRQILGDDEPNLSAFDQDSWARRLGYTAADETTVREALQLFALLRSSTARLLRQASPERWDAWGQHSERGRVTLRDTVVTFTRHAEEHVAQLRQIKG